MSQQIPFLRLSIGQETSIGAMFRDLGYDEAEARAVIASKLRPFLASELERIRRPQAEPGRQMVAQDSFPCTD